MSRTPVTPEVPTCTLCDRFIPFGPESRDCAECGYLAGLLIIAEEHGICVSSALLARLESRLTAVMAAEVLMDGMSA